MAEVRWIKLETDMFDNKKIKYLRRLPEGNSIVLIWVMLLSAAGRCNFGGTVFLTESIPFTPEMLSYEFGFDESTVTLALKELENLDMITFEGDFITIKNWNKHQNTDKMEKIKEQTRSRVAKYREKKMVENRNASCNAKSNVTGNADVTQCNATEEDVDVEEEADVDVDKEDVDKYLKRDKKEHKRKDKEGIVKGRNDASASPSPPRAPLRHKFGQYQNVLLSDDDLEKLREEFPLDYEERIDNLSGYIASTGRAYKNHLATIRNWAREDERRGMNRNGKRGNGSFKKQKLHVEEYNLGETLGD